MNGHVHYTLTRRWAREAGLDEETAEIVARWDVGTDALYPGSKRTFLGYHFARQGADELAEAYLGRAVRTRDPRYLGVALHCAQDAVGHGRLNRLLHWPGIDIWQRRSARIRRRLESRSKELVRSYLSGEVADGRLPDVPVLPEELPLVRE